MKNPALTPEQAQQLTYPRLMEVWDEERSESEPSYSIISEFNDYGFVSYIGLNWENAAEPPAEIAEAMRAQFAWQPKRMMVWDVNEADAKERIVIADLGEKVKARRFITVSLPYESDFLNGEEYGWHYYHHAKPLPDPITEEIAELKRRIAELEQKRSNQ
jgi:hypothetical protein